MSREQIETLQKRYLDGETTNEEEQLLRQYFTTTQMVPTEWKAYQALFNWEVSGQHSVKSNDTALMPSRHTRYERLAVAASIAAFLLFGAGIMAMLLRSSHAELQQNYAVLNGHYTTDAAIVAREAEEALLMVSATDDDTFDAINILATP